MSNQVELPPFVYAKAFWEAFSIVVAGLLAILVYFGKVDPSWGLPSAVILMWILALLRMFGITPELRERLLSERLERAERLLEESMRVRNDLMGLKAQVGQTKPAKLNK